VTGLQHSRAIHLQKAGLHVLPGVKAVELCCTNLLVLVRALCCHCSDRLQTLFTSSMESTKTVAAMLAQSGGSVQQSYWTSPQTQQVIEQEEELRSVVFAQMLGATS